MPQFECQRLWFPRNFKIGDSVEYARHPVSKPDGTIDGNWVPGTLKNILSGIERGRGGVVAEIELADGRTVHVDSRFVRHAT